MGKYALGLVVLMISISLSYQSQNVPCEEINNIGGWGSIEPQRSCVLKVTTTIISPGSKFFSRVDDSVKGIEFWENKKVFYLPEGASEKFPNLLGFSAGHCSVKTIGREIFRGLSKVKDVLLEDNQIEGFPSDTFDDLVSLVYLSLNGNRIKILGQKVLQTNLALTIVKFSSNLCINEDFSSPSRIDAMRQVLIEKCSISNDLIKEVVQGPEVDLCSAEKTELQEKLIKTLAENESLMNKNQENAIEIAKMKNKIHNFFIQLHSLDSK